MAKSAYRNADKCQNETEKAYLSGAGDAYSAMANLLDGLMTGIEVLIPKKNRDY